MGHYRPDNFRTIGGKGWLDGMDRLFFIIYKQGGKNEKVNSIVIQHVGLGFYGTA